MSSQLVLSNCAIGAEAGSLTSPSDVSLHQLSVLSTSPGDIFPRDSWSGECVKSSSSNSAFSAAVHRSVSSVGLGRAGGIFV